MSLALRPMTEAEFAAYLDFTVPEYAREHMQAGNWHPAEALEKARQSYAQLLPQGTATPDQYLSILVDDTGSRVGIAWLGLFRKIPRIEAWVYDLFIDPEQRRKGFGRQAMRLLEDQARQLGAVKIGLHVFSNNLTAHKLYERAGYHDVDVVMAKDLNE